MSMEQWWNDSATEERQGAGTAPSLIATMSTTNTLPINVIFENDDVQLRGYVGRGLDNT